MPSDVVIVQLIASAVTLISLWIHRMHGSRENQAIKVLVNGQRTELLQKIDTLQLQLVKLTGENLRLTEQMEKKITNETDSP